MTGRAQPANAMLLCNVLGTYTELGTVLGTALGTTWLVFGSGTALAPVPTALQLLHFTVSPYSLHVLHKVLKTML